jgi:serine/threonine-protein kinase ATR
MHLAQSNLVLRGVAYMQVCLKHSYPGRTNYCICWQLRKIAQNRCKSPYNLIFPYMSDVAPLVVSRLCTHPLLLRETCQLFTMGQAGFLSMTLAHTLPHVVANRDAKVLQRIAEHVQEAPASLLVNHMELVLPHIFLLQDSSETEAALKFIAQTISSDANGRKIHVDQIIKSCVVDLLTTLVISLGDDSEIRRTAVRGTHVLC